MTVSSAKKSKSVKSIIKIENRIGPKIDPWGTPLDISDLWPSAWTH